jgi:hypothetical protein
MTRYEYEEIRRQLAEVSTFLKQGNPTSEEKLKLEVIQAQLAGLLLNPWFPFGWVRRSTMGVLFLVGVLGLLAGNVYFVTAWVCMLCFSPRIVGELSSFAGKFSSNG